MSDTNTQDDAEVVDQATIRRAILSSVIGNGLEWYDYMLYGFFSIFIAKAFFPEESLFVQTLMTFLTFSFAFLFRPIGGLILGIYSDRYGRKPALILMIMMMGVSTVLIGLTPSYATIGISATLLIIFARILQGISVGGEFGGATAMLIEYAPKDKQMFYASFQTFAQSLATFLAAGLGLLMVTMLEPEQAEQWGWRVLFLLGGIIAPIGLYIRSRVPETPAFLKAQKNNIIVKSPLKEVLTKHKKELIAGLGLVAIGGSANYVWFVYMTFFVVHELQLPIEDIFLSDLIAGVILMVVIFFTGKYCQRLGAFKVLICGIVLFGITAYPLLAYVVEQPNFVRLIIAQSIGACFMGLIWAPTPGIFAGLFPPQVRATGMSLSYNVGVIIFGAMAVPLLTVVTEYTGDKLVPAYYLSFCAVLSLLLINYSKEKVSRALALP